ncbi:tetratricopeptide repeat protein [Calothrix sp. NIES-3974]|uniref:tetratricopeptide repeat protein n=1 Tax=Calothrix sp. NIES-3974 TaxID=2005462 RepID=UPI000B60B748|nr:tetratricopeptide repeat protein [Calothrix sp. NIES-3974]BAZ03884.1 TPR repeat-containing protein [Calothrix sp. NIES-3974]
MEWITLLQKQQLDFVKRFASGYVLHNPCVGLHSELTVITGERLIYLRDFCWKMAEKYKRVSSVRDVFVNFLKGKLGEEVIKERLGGLVSEVDYAKRWGGDDKIDFTLTSNPEIAIAVKSRCGDIDRVRWAVSSQEVEKNAIIACVLIQEEVSEAENEYHLYLAGFLPSEMVKLRTGRIFFGINQLLYGGGMAAYLELLNQQSMGEKSANSLSTPQQSQSGINFTPLNHDINPDNYIQYYRDLMTLQIKLGDDYVEKGELEAAITAYHQALNLSHQSMDDVQIYYKIGLTRQQMHDYEGAISDYLNAIAINPNYAPAYQKMGLARYQIGDYEGALADYTCAIQINPHDILSYINRAYARSQLHDNQGAIEDYTYAIQLQSHTPATDTNQSNQHQEIIEQILANIEINPTTAVEYKQRAHSRYDLGDYEGAIADYTQALQIHPSDADTYYQRGKVHHERGDEYTALEDLNRSIQLDTHQPDAYYLRGEIYDAKGNKQLALADMHRAAEIYRHQGKLGEHKKVRDRILELDIEQSLDSLNF